MKRHRTEEEKEMLRKEADRAKEPRQMDLERIDELEAEVERLRKWHRIIANELYGARSMRVASRKALDGEHPTPAQSADALDAAEDGQS